MNLTKILRTFLVAALLGSLVFIVSSCNDDDKATSVDYGTVTGVVTDDNGAAVAGVTVALTGVDGTVTTGADGKYVMSNVPIESHAVTFSKTGYQTISITVTANKFDGNKVATTNISMLIATAKITGTVTDAKNAGAPLSGVVINYGAAETITTGADGKYIIENLVMGDYTVTFTKDNFVSITRMLTKADFVSEVATLDVRMGGNELLRGLTADDLKTADKWYYSEYRGGGNGNPAPHWDWACDYMSALTFVGNWEEQWEGTTLRIRNETNDQKNPANLDVFDSFVYGSKLITADSKILTLSVRTHNADAANPANFGVQVIDLSAGQPVAVKIGGNKAYGSDSYTNFDFDLSAYIGKEVVIAIGTYRAKTGDYWKQLVLRRIAFAQEAVTSDWFPGDEVVNGWKLTHQMVRSTMPHPKRTFTGISPISAGRDVNMTSGYPAAYRAWRNVAHIGYEWSFMPLTKDPEVFPSEGYLIKTRGGGTAVNTLVPESYYYAKFAIAAGSNQLTLKTRNFGGNYTFFKLTAIKDDGTVTHIAPSSNTATSASSAADGCWKFKHDAGSKDNPNTYASFVYDLSQFNGNNVTLVFGVYKGEANGDESKLVFYSIDLK